MSNKKATVIGNAIGVVIGLAGVCLPWPKESGTPKWARWVIDATSAISVVTGVVTIRTTLEK